MEITYTPEELVVFQKISEAASALKMPAYIIGGFVRDKILNRPTKDADIVCIGDGIELAKKVSEKFLPKSPVNFFKNFGTAQIKIIFMAMAINVFCAGKRYHLWKNNSQ